MASADRAKVQELKEKISDQKEKIETLKNYYEEKIDKLDNKKQALEFKASGLKFIPGAGKKAGQKLDEMKAVSDELSDMRKKKREELAEAKEELEKLKNEYNDAKEELKAKRAEGAKTIEKKIKTKKKSQIDLFKASVVIGIIGLLIFVPSSFTAIGEGSAKGVGGFGIFVGLVAVVLSIWLLLQAKKKGEKLIKPIIALSLAGVVALGCLIAVIADPIAVNSKCSAYNSVEEMKIGDSSLCKDRVAELEKQKQDEENARKEAAIKAKDECSAKSYSWNSSENRCNTDEEQKKEDTEKKAKSECSAKNYDWKYSENRCNTDSEQQVANQKKAEEEAKRAEANKTTTYTGTDHDENDSAGRYVKITNACLDRLDHHYPGTLPLGSYDGYTIYYSVTLKGDGTLVEGFMNGYHRTKNGQKILSYKCIYENGLAKIQGLD